MIMRVLTFIVGAIVVYGAVTWLAEPGNGRQLGNSGGEVASTGVDAVGGAGDVFEGVLDGLTR
jgi:hypothetical protein